MNSFSSEPDCESLAPDLSAVTQKGLALVETFQKYRVSVLKNLRKMNWLCLNLKWMTQVMRQHLEKRTASQESTEDVFEIKANSRTYEKPSQA